jgi:hypothetical protein
MSPIWERLSGVCKTEEIIVNLVAELLPSPNGNAADKRPRVTYVPLTQATHPSDGLRCPSIAHLHNVVQVVAHGHEQVKEKFTAPFHLRLHYTQSASACHRKSEKIARGNGLGRKDRRDEVDDRSTQAGNDLLVPLLLNVLRHRMIRAR